MDNKEIQFSETEDTSLKRFLKGNRIYTMLAAAIIAAVIFIPTIASIIGIYSNVKQSQNVITLSEAATAGDLDGVYVTGGAYKFLTKIGYIAESEAAATEYYYLMYIDAPDGTQIATLVAADKRGDADIEAIIDAYLAYVQNPDAGYRGNIVEVTGRFKNPSSQESNMLKQAINKLGINSPVLGYTLKVRKMPAKSDTVPYWFFAFPFGCVMIVCSVLFVYGLILEDKRARANESPYPYLNKKKK